MIPKLIHYCWFGGAPKPKSVIKCIDSWKKHCPDYEIIEWNESNIDIGMNNYTQQAYEAKSWGFVPDYLRLWIIYNHGGIYLDTDVQVIGSFDSLLEKKAFGGFEAGCVEKGLYVALGLGFGAEAGNSVIKEHMDMYSDLLFVNPDGSYNKTPSPSYTTELLVKHGLNRYSDSIQVCGDFTVYSTDYFCPKSFYNGLTHMTENSVSIHHYDASWFDDNQQKKKKKRWKAAKKLARLQKLDYLIHTPNRVLLKMLGNERYNKFKRVLGKK